jgi:hypothetical protein
LDDNISHIRVQLTIIPLMKARELQISPSHLASVRIAISRPARRKLILSDAFFPADAAEKSLSRCADLPPAGSTSL